MIDSLADNTFPEPARFSNRDTGERERERVLLARDLAARERERALNIMGFFWFNRTVNPISQSRPHSSPRQCLSLSNSIFSSI